MSVGYLQITYADYEANEFRTVGGAGFLTMAETRRRFRAIPEAPEPPKDGPGCLVLDLLDRHSDILADKIIDLATAEALMGGPIDLTRPVQPEPTE